MTQLPKPIIQNRFPKSVAMRLHFTPKVPSQVSSQVSFQASSQTFPQSAPKSPDLTTAAMAAAQIPLSTPPSTAALSATITDIDLGLTISFGGHHEIEVPGAKLLGLPSGKVPFGIRRGWLQVRLNRGYLVPLKALTPSPAFAVVPNVNVDYGDTEHHSDDRSQIKAVQTAWLFEVKEEQPILEGILPATPLATLQPLSTPSTLPSAPSVLPSTSSSSSVPEPYQVIAEFRVQRQDVRITWDRTVLGQKLTRNQLAAIEQALILKYIGPQLEASPLSEVRWHYV